MGPSDCLRAITNWHKDNIPSPDVLIDIPQNEKFPLDILSTFQPDSPEEFSNMFLKAQLQTVSHVETTDNIIGKSIDPQIFPTEQEFSVYKSDIASTLSSRSIQEELSVPLAVCQEPLCVQLAVPSFQYELKIN